MSIPSLQFFGCREPALIRLPRGYQVKRRSLATTLRRKDGDTVVEGESPCFGEQGYASSTGLYCSGLMLNVHAAAWWQVCISGGTVR